MKDLIDKIEKFAIWNMFHNSICDYDTVDVNKQKFKVRQNNFILYIRILPAVRSIFPKNIFTSCRKKECHFSYAFEEEIKSKNKLTYNSALISFHREADKEQIEYSYHDIHHPDFVLNAVQDDRPIRFQNREKFINELEHSPLISHLFKKKNLEIWNNLFENITLELI